MRSTFLVPLLLFVSTSLVGGCYIPSQYDEYYPARSVGHGLDRQIRPAKGVDEVRRIAKEVLAQTNWNLSIEVYVDPSMGRRIANIQGSGNRATIRIGQKAVAEFPANTWAFILGHEFAHAIMSPHHRPGASPSEESRVDLAGAEFAVQAGYDVAAQIGWMLILRDNRSSHHGAFHDRAYRLARHFQVKKHDFQYWRNFYAMRWPYKPQP